MDENCSRKLVVEVCNARNLMPKDGQGTASAYVIVDFDGQRRRTKTKFRDLNPQWDEKFEFLVLDSESMADESLELNVYNDKKTGSRRGTFLGKIKIPGSSFAQSGTETLVYYPLEKRSVFSQIKGEIGVKIFYVDENPPVSEASAPSEEKSEVAPSTAATEEKSEAASSPAATEEKKIEQKAENQEGKTEEKKDEKAEDEKKEKTEEKKVEEGKSIEESKAEEMLAEKSKSEEAQAPRPPPTEVELLQVTRPDLGVKDMKFRSLADDRSRSGYDLVDCMPFLYVRVVKATGVKEEAGSSAFAKLVVGTRTIRTKSQSGKDWDQVFAFDKEALNSTSLEVSVWTEKKDADPGTETSLGTVSFDLQEAPKRVPPDSPLAPQWYTLEGSPGEIDVMIAVWFGTQADEVFQEAWQSDSGGLLPETRAKVYLSPKLCYLRLTVIQTQDLQLAWVSEPKVRGPDLYVKAQLGSQVFKTARTSLCSSSSANPTWNEDILFVAAEPFEPFLVVSVEDVTNGQQVGHAKIHVPSVDRRISDETEPTSRWFNLICGEGDRYAGRIHVRACLEGGYHVLDEAAHVSSDVRAAAKQIVKPAIGLLEVGIRGATNLLPVKTKDGTRGTTDAYVVAKYGPKWVRTRTILDRFNPRWNEQYTWDVYDPCTVLTLGVFDNGRYKQDTPGTGKAGKDLRIGKLRVRLSTLDTNRAYVNSYPLTVLLPGGAKMMGEIEIAVRFTCPSWLSLIQAYATPVLPKMHYVRPMGRAQQDVLRYTAMRIVTSRLARTEPALGQEVVQFMLDSDTHVWSMRKSKANWFRLLACLSRAASFARWLDGVRKWVHPLTTVLAHGLLLALVFYPHLLLPTLFMYAFLILALRFRYRPRAPLSIDPRLSYVDAVGLDELDEEFDGFPTNQPLDQVRVRYDRLRALAGRIQTLLGDIAGQGERLEAVFNWHDPRATGIFVVFCLFASLMFYAVPFKAFALGSGLYYLRHPRFRGDMPSIALNFFRRLPSLADQIL
ncbi:multiple C2 domain and transmembrane region protein 14 [Malania oleifera]|uniref:multiple C2 domain and transmembrane region protein 14 n=1 Tax=Malania oleifera TaxID=397392 RepID=UPI0025ADCEB2|nr:multiple C2 domain and transmembrane region protein 14 [Malania oleifera]